MGGLCSHSLELTGLAGDAGSPVHRLDPRAKVVGFVAITVIAVSAPVALWPVYAGCLLVLASIALAARIPPGAIFRRVRWVLPLVLAAALLLPLLTKGGATWQLGPFTVYEQGLEVFGAVVAKATIGTLSAAMLSMTTTFPAVLRALETMRLPATLVLIAGLMYRYLFVIVAETERMRAGMSSRGYRPRTALQAAPMGRAATAMFLRTYARGERVHRAMLARGYDGTMPRLTPLAIGRTDLIFAGGIVVSLLALRVGLGVGG